MDSDAILTAVNAVESITNPPHTPERSSYRARKTVEQIIHLIFDQLVFLYIGNYCMCQNSS